MKSEKQILIEDLLADAENQRRRAAVLSAGGTVLRRRRYTRLGVRCGMIAMVACLAVLAGQRMGERKNNTRFIAANPPVETAKAEVHYLTDDELLALFPDTPVGLATVGGKKRLIFPRPGDEVRFISRLPN